MYRVFFDENEMVDRKEEDGHIVDYYALKLSLSVADLNLIPGGPRQGMIVILYEDGLEVKAELDLNQEYGYWVGRGIPGTYRDVPYQENS